jgi:hypothetical protein
MPPTFELVMGEGNPPESFHNHKRLAVRFSELEKKNDIFIIQDPDYNEEHIEIRNEFGEELYIYPDSKKWFFNKEQNLKFGDLKILDLVNIIPLRENNDDLQILITNNNLESIEHLKMYRSHHSSSYFFGKVELTMCGECGDYFTDKEHYNQVKRKLEELTGLKIEDFFVRIFEPSEGKGILKYGIVQIAIELK